MRRLEFLIQFVNTILSYIFKTPLLLSLMSLQGIANNLITYPSSCDTVAVQSLVSVLVAKTLFKVELKLKSTIIMLQ